MIIKAFNKRLFVHLSIIIVLHCIGLQQLLNIIFLRHITGRYSDDWYLYAFYASSPMSKSHWFTWQAIFLSI